MHCILMCRVQEILLSDHLLSEGAYPFGAKQHMYIYIYICRAVSPLNGRTAIKVDGGGGGF